MAYSGRQQAQNLPGATPRTGNVIVPGTSQMGSAYGPPPPPPGPAPAAAPANAPGVNQGGNRTNKMLGGGLTSNFSYMPGADLLQARELYQNYGQNGNVLNRGMFDPNAGDAGPTFDAVGNSYIENPMQVGQQPTQSQAAGNSLFQHSMGNIRASNAPTGLGFGRSNSLGVVRQFQLTGNEAMANDLTYTPAAAPPPPPPPPAAPPAPAPTPAAPTPSTERGAAPGATPPPGYAGIPGAGVNQAHGQFDSGFAGPGNQGPPTGPRYEPPSSIREVTGSALKGFTYNGKYTDVMKIPDAALKTYLIQNPQYLKAGWTVINGQILRQL